MLPHLRISAAIIAANSAGVLPTGSSAESGEPRLHVGAWSARAISVCRRSIDRRRRRGRRHDAVPRGHVEPGQSRFLDGRHRGRRAMRFGLATASARSLPLATCWHRRGRRGEHHLHLAATRSFTAGAMPLYGTCCDARCRPAVEQLAREVRAAALAGRGEVELAGIRLRIGDELAEVLRRHGRMHHQHVGRRREHRDRREVARGVERQLAVRIGFTVRLPVGASTSV